MVVVDNKNVDLRQDSNTKCAFCGRLIEEYGNRKIIKGENVGKGTSWYFCSKKHKKLFFQGEKFNGNNYPPFKRTQDNGTKKTKSSNGREMVSFSLDSSLIAELQGFIDGKRYKYVADVLRDAVDEYLERHQP